jgi:quercetin dioxygenase-like cupin family protein
MLDHLSEGLKVLTDDPRGTATPLHLHCNEEEAFYVLEGEVTVVVEGQWSELSAGDYALVTRNTPHAYVVRSERARMLVTFSPSGFEVLGEAQFRRPRVCWRG